MKKEREEGMEYFTFCSKVIGTTIIRALRELEVKPEDSIGVVAYTFDNIIRAIALGLGLNPNKVLRDIASCMVENNPPMEDISHDMESIIKEAERIMNGSAKNE